MRIDFEVGGVPACVELGAWGRRRVTLGSRVVAYAPAWRSLRMLLASGGHAAEVRSRFLPWPHHRVVQDGVPDPRAKVWTGLSRLPIWAVIFYVVLGWALCLPQGEALYVAATVGPRWGMADYILVSTFEKGRSGFARAEADSAVWLRRYAWLFGNAPEALLPIAQVYLRNGQPEEATRLVEAALQGPARAASSREERTALFVLFGQLVMARACDAADALVRVHPEVLPPYSDVMSVSMGCRGWPVSDHASRAAATFDAPISSLRLLLWSDSNQEAAQFADAMARSMFGDARTLLVLRAEAYARVGRMADRDAALDDLLGSAPCAAPMLLDSESMAESLRGDELLRARLRAACASGALPSYQGLVRAQDASPETPRALASAATSIGQ